MLKIKYIFTYKTELGFDIKKAVDDVEMKNVLDWLRFIKAEDIKLYLVDFENELISFIGGVPKVDGDEIRTPCK